MSRTAKTAVVLLLGLAALAVAVTLGLSAWESEGERLIRRLRSSEIDVQVLAAEEIGKRGMTEAVEPLLRTLESIPERIGWTMGKGVANSNLACYIHPAEPPVRHADGDSQRLAWAVGESLRSVVAAADQEVVLSLTQRLASKDAHVAAFAAFLLSRLGPEAVDAIPELAAALNRGRDDPVHLYAAIALSRIGEAAVPTLRKAVVKYPYPSIVANALDEAED